MQTQTSLFDLVPPLAHQRGSATSHAAALKATTFAPSQRRRLLDRIAYHGPRGLTRKEAEVELSICTQSLCLRFRELEKATDIQRTDIIRDGCRVFVAVGK